MKVEINGKQTIIFPNDVIGIVVATDHKGRNATQIILKEGAFKAYGLTSGVISVETTYLETLLALIIEQAQLNGREALTENFIDLIRGKISTIWGKLKNGKK